MKAADAINRATSYFTSQVNQPQSLRLFTILVYAWFLMNMMMVFSTRHLLWGPGLVFHRHGFPSTFIENFFYQLLYSTERFYPFFFGHIACALLSLFDRKWSFIPRILTWISGLALYYAAIETFNSGMLLMLLMAFYCSVVYTRSKNPYRIAMSNVARWACMIQVVLVYAVAGIYKLSGDQWLDGSAIHYTLHIDHFSSEGWRSFVNQHAAVGMVMTYAALAYQLLFPVLVWFRKIRLWLLAAGILFHLFIGVVMHLWDFALAMMFCYVLFTDDRSLQKIRSIFSSNY